MQSIYEQILGDEYSNLHPKLQYRYQIKKDAPFFGEGTMEVVDGGSFLIRQVCRLGVKYRLFFSERGEQIPFTIENLVQSDARGKTIVTWNRTFMFSTTRRYFDAIMFYEEQEQEIYDYFGVPSIMISTLSFKVINGNMHIAPKKQWLKVFGLKLPLPRFLYGQAEIIESYDDEHDCYRIQVHVHNSIVGTVFYYKGSFQEGRN